MLQSEQDKHSLNIKKIDEWGIPYVEIQTIPSRKELLDYMIAADAHVQKNYPTRWKKIANFIQYRL